MKEREGFQGLGALALLVSCIISGVGSLFSIYLLRSFGDSEMRVSDYIILFGIPSGFLFAFLLCRKKPVLGFSFGTLWLLGTGLTLAQTDLQFFKFSLVIIVLLLVMLILALVRAIRDNQNNISAERRKNFIDQIED